MACLLIQPAKIIAVTPFVEQFGLKDGLSNSEIRCIFQDKQGYMWFGTYDGLNRYDGYDVKVYRNRPGDTTSLIHNYINTITEDAYGNVWAGTRQGVSVLNSVTQKFSRVKVTKNVNGEYTLLNAYISNISTDASGNIFVASQGDGLIIFTNAGRNKKGKEIPLRIGENTIWDYDARSICMGSLGKIYLLVANVGLCSYDAGADSVRLIDPTVKDGTCLLEENGNLWVGANSGLFQFSLVKKCYIRSFFESEDRLSSSRVTSIALMSRSELWIGTDGGGLDILDENTGKFSYMKQGFDHHSLTSNTVYAVFRDKESRKWLGTLRGGVNIIDDSKNRFQHIAHDPTNPNSLVDNFVKSLFEDKDGEIWIGTDGGGLSRWDRKADRFENFKADKKQSGAISSNFITGINKDYENAIWITTYGGGIDRYQPASNSFKTYTGFSTDGKRQYGLFWTVYEDHSRNLWASGLQNGLFLFDRERDQFIQKDPDMKNIITLYEDHRQQLWAGTFEGLYQMDADGKNHRFYRMGTPIRAIHEDSFGHLWLGTEAGLMLFDRANHRVARQLTMDNGLSNNTVLGVEEDSQGHLWMSTFNGLSRLDIRTNVITNFSESDGLQNREFSFNASLSLKNGELAFGGVSGLTLFDPKQIVPLKRSANIVINEIKVNNVPLSDRPSYITATDHNRVSNITIPYDEAALAINFSAIEFTAQDRTAYRYKLTGWDRGWNDIGHLRNAIYTKLEPGQYDLLVNYTDPEGEWTKQYATLHIIVLPPWYRSWLAYAIYAGIFFTCLYWFVAYRLRETRLKYEIKLAKANAENQQLLQNKEREMNERRVEFFTGIAHEFRTPLSLIINPARDLIKRHDSPGHEDLNIIFRNARRLLSLVDQLLLFQKADVAKQLNIAPLHIIQVCKEVFVCFVQQAKSAGISFELIAPDTDIILYADREKIEIVLFNLVSNALKYTPRGKSVKLNITESMHEVEISVIDSGTGIPVTIGERIFDKFYRSQEAGKPVKAGFGIGLYLARQFTTDHQGALTYTSREGEGTTFLLKLKKGVAHYQEELISTIEPSHSELLDELTTERFNNKKNMGSLPPEAFKTVNIFSDKKSVLVIDDDDDIRNYIKNILNDLYIVYEAENGDQGLLAARDKHPDLIICDVMMPGMDGIELCSIIKQDAQLSYIPMILLTASSSLEGKIKGLESGADDYISKPFEKDILVARVANLLQIRNDLQSYFYNAITLKPANIAISEEYKHFLEKCIDIVEKHIADPDFSIKTLADEVGMSHSNLYRKVKSLSGNTVNGFIRYIRLRKAAELLIHSEMNVNQVAIETGFNNIKYFRAQFFKLFGSNPSDFLRQNKPVFIKRFNVID